MPSFVMPDFIDNNSMKAIRLTSNIPLMLLKERKSSLYVGYFVENLALTYNIPGDNFTLFTFTF